MANPATAAPLTREAIASELERIAASQSFRKAERCLRLLRYLADSALQGRTSELKEYTLAVNVFDRPASFDPRVDPVVRLEARRLRLKLAEYYQHEGREDAVVVELPKGAYVPCFRLREEPQSPQPPTSRAPLAGTGRPLHLWLPAAAAALALSLGAGYLLMRHERPVVRTSVAVLGFSNLSGSAESSWIASAVSELMDLELKAGQQLRTEPPDNVARMQRELSIAPQRSYPVSTLQRIGTDLGTAYAVGGAYQADGNRVHLDVALFDLRSGRQLAAIDGDSSREELADLARNCARRIRAQLGVRLSSPGQTAVPPPIDPSAMDSYARGMERLRMSDALGARAFLERAAASSPVNPFVLSGLAAAYSALGLDRRAQAEAKSAFESSTGLGRIEQLEIEGRYAELAHDWPRAVRVYQALFTLFPDDLEYGLLLASTETNGGQAKDAQVTISALRRLPKPGGEDPRIDLAEARSAGALADFAHTRRAAQRAAEKAGQRGARLQYARARLLESGAMQNLQIEGYRGVRAEARNICAELGDRSCVAAAFRIEANELALSGAPAKARPLYANVLQIADEIGNQLEKLNALQGIAFTEQSQGDLHAAEADYRAAVAVASELGEQKRYQCSLDLADVLAREGKVGELRTLSQAALDSASRDGDRESVAQSRTLLARATALEGKFAESMASYHQAIAAWREVQEPRQLVDALLGLGEVQVDEGDRAAARESLRAAQEMSRRYDPQQPEVDLGFARLELAAGEFQAAANHARSALNAYASGGREGDRLHAAALLSRALVASGDIAAASRVLAAIPSPDGRSFPIEAQVEFRIARCLVNAHNGRRAEAGVAMDTIAREVSRLGLPLLEKETRQAQQQVLRATNIALPR